jgi:hypothetical protein
MIDDPWLPISLKYSMIRERFKGFYEEERMDTPGLKLPGRVSRVILDV